MTQLKPLSLEGVYEILPPLHKDSRGELVKIVHRPTFEDHGLHSDFPEVLFTTSVTGVLRGLHYQKSPHAQIKLIHCIRGAVMDVLVDLRQESTTYGRFETMELNDRLSNGLYLPPGIAHGFYTRTGPATLMYHMSAVYAPNMDTGIHWNSVPARWPNRNPIISKRDKALPTFEEAIRQVSSKTST